MTGTKRYWRRRQDLVQQRERKLKAILTLTREKVLKEGWHSCTMRGVIRLLKQHNLNYSYYIPTKLALGLALAEQEYALLVRIFRDERKKQYSPRQTLTNCTELMMFHFRHSQNLLDIWLDSEIISQYNNLAQSSDNQRVELINTRRQFLQEIYFLLYQLTQEKQTTNASNEQNPYLLLNSWLYHFIGMSRLGLYQDLAWSQDTIATSLSLLIPDKSFGVTL